MALSIPTLIDTTTYSGAASAARTTPSLSPTASALLVVCVVTWKSAGDAGTITPTDTFTGTGAWTVRDTVVVGNLRVSVATAQLGATPGSGTITITVSGTGTRWTIHTSTVTGHNTTTPIPQFANNSAASGTTLTVTLGSTPASTSMVLGVVGDHWSTDTNIVPGTGFTELVETAVNPLQSEVQYDLTGADTTCDWTGLNGAAGSGIAAVAVEIAEAPAGGSVVPVLMREYRQRRN